MRSLSLLAAALLLLPPAGARNLEPADHTLTSPSLHGGGLEAGRRDPFRLGAENPQGLLLARAGGRAGGGGGGDARAGGGGGRAARGNTGFDRTPRSFDRGNRQPSGGWSRDVANRPDRARPTLDRSAAAGNRMARPAAPGGERINRPDRGASLNRDAIRDRAGTIDHQAARDRMAAVNRDNVPDRTANREALRDRTANRDALRDRANTVNRDDWDRASDRLQNGWNERQNNLNAARDTWNNNRSDLNNRLNNAVDRYNNYWPGWARPGWGLARPWNWGWYGGWANPPWGWWAARSVAWGLTSLATAAVINDSVNNAIAANQTLIVVPESSYQLYYNSIEPSGDQTVTFVAVAGNGGEAQTWTADCRSGSLNGYQPAAAAEAQLLNAACQVAFGS